MSYDKLLNPRRKVVAFEGALGMLHLNEPEATDFYCDRHNDPDVPLEKPRFTQFLGLPILSWISLILGGVCATLVWFSDSYF